MEPPASAFFGRQQLQSRLLRRECGRWPTAVAECLCSTHWEDSPLLSLGTSAGAARARTEPAPRRYVLAAVEPAGLHPRRPGRRLVPESDLPRLLISTP